MCALNQPTIKGGIYLTVILVDAIHIGEDISTLLDAYDQAT